MTGEGRRCYGAAVSTHPSPPEAAGEVIGQVLDAVGVRPDLAVLFATAPYVGVLEDVAATVQTTLDPAAFVGATASAVLGGGLGVEDRPALALWAARLPGEVQPVHLTASGEAGAWRVAGLGADDAIAHARTLLLLADPFSFPVEGFVGWLAQEHPGTRAVGGLASAAGGNRLVVGGRLVQSGAVGVLLDRAASPATVVSQGCRPVGPPFVVTRAERHLLHDLGGRPALERVLEIVEALPAHERSLAARGLHCGIVVDESKPEYARGDFLVRSVLGADRASGAVAVGAEVPVGTTVQLHVRDAATAGEDLRNLLRGHDAGGALLFTCTGRGSGMFGDPHHDAGIVHDHVGAAVAGMFCAGEVGPVGGRTAVHAFTAAVALFPR